MKKDIKELLLKDLCARLPHGVKVQYKNYVGTIDLWTTDYKFTLLVDDNIQIPDVQDSLFIEIEEIKPYLFPLSSMTEKQKEEYRKACELDTEILSKHPMDGTPFPVLYNSQDWINAHHFDYRGLIPMELANDATGLDIYG